MDFQSIINTVCFYVILYEIPYCRNLNTLYKPGKAPLFLLYSACFSSSGMVQCFYPSS